MIRDLDLGQPNSNLGQTSSKLVMEYFWAKQNYSYTDNILWCTPIGPYGNKICLFATIILLVTF